MPAYGNAAFASDTAAITNALIVPVVGAVISVELPVITRSIVAALPVHRTVQILKLGRARVSDAINERADRMTICSGINVDGDGSILGKDRTASQERDRN